TLLVLFFFFQAEDGIRDFHVTGVQTCALPIWPIFWFPSFPHDALIFISVNTFSTDCMNDSSVIRHPAEKEGKKEYLLPGANREEIGRASCRERVEMLLGSRRRDTNRTNRKHIG